MMAEYYQAGSAVVCSIFPTVCTVQNTLVWIYGYLYKLKEANKIVKRLLSFIECMQSELKKVEMYTNEDDGHEGKTTDSSTAKAHLQSFLDHINTVKSSLESSESDGDKGIVSKMSKLFSSPKAVKNLLVIEEELKLAMDKLQLFITILTLKVACESRDSTYHKLNELSDEIKAIQENDVGIECVPSDPAVKRPSAPRELTIMESKNKFVLSWKPSGEEIDKFELCYNESKNRTCTIDKTISNIEIGAPKVKPGPKNLVYTMKIRGVCGSIKGEWSNTVVGQFTKPLPQKPTIKKLFLRSTIAEITVATPAAICATESPVTRWQVAYIIDTGTEWLLKEFAVEADKPDQTFRVHDLEPKRKYTFKVKAMNAEGWGDFSDKIFSSTNQMPPQIAKPSPPLIEAVSRSAVKITVESPEGTNFMAPVILWEVTATYFDCNECKEIVKKITFNKLNYGNECSSFNMVDLVPKQQYNFEVIAKNERGWSQSSDAVIAFTGPPLRPPTIRPSSLKSTSFVKVRWELPSKYTRPSYYEICKKTTGDDGKKVEAQYKIPSHKSSATFSNLNENTTYYFRICSWNGRYVSEWSKEIEVITDYLPIRKIIPNKVISALSLGMATKNTDSDYTSTLETIRTAKADKGAELSDQSEDEDPVIFA